MPRFPDPYLRRRAPTRWSLLVSTLVVLLVIAADMLTGGAIRAAVRPAGARIFAGGVRAQEALFGSYFSSKASLAAQNQALSERLAQCEEQDAHASTLADENAQLRELARVAQDVPGVTVPVVSSVRASPYGTFSIGAGEADGIAKGSLVATGDGFVIGRVADTGAHESLVALLTAPGTSIEGIVGSSSLQFDGRGGGTMRATAPRGLVIETGTAIYAPTAGQRPIAVVGHVASSSSDAAQTVYARVPANLDVLRYVYVIR